MPRPRFQREPCDCLDCKEGGPPPPTAAAAAVARQEPPPKSFVLCIDGALQREGGLAGWNLPHLHALVRGGWAGLLASRSGGPSLPLQLLGLPAAGVAPLQLLADRFKQLRAVLLTDSPEVAQAGKLAGCYAVHCLPAWQPPALLAARIYKMLHVQPWRPAGAAAAAAAPTLPALAAVLSAAGQEAGCGTAAAAAAAVDEEEGDDVVDMLLLVLHAANAPGSSGNSINDHSNGSDSGDGTGDGNSCAEVALEWADALLSGLNQAPGFRDTVLTSLVVGSGEQLVSQEPLLTQDQPLLTFKEQQLGIAAPAGAATAADPVGSAEAGDTDAAVSAAAECPAVRRPAQSYQFMGLDRVKVDAHRPALVVHRLAGVIRVDTAAALDLAVIRERGAAGCTLAEHLLPQVAYKLGRAPKYGA